MTITWSIDHLSTSVEDVSVEVAPKSEMTLQSTTTDPKTGEITSVYNLASGDNAFLASVTYRSSIQKRAIGDVRKISMTFSTWATMSNSFDGTETKKPVSVSCTILGPADMTLEVADLDDLIGNGFSYLYASVTSKVRDTSWLGKLLYGVPQVK